MNLLERLLGHDYATTRELLIICLELSDEQMDRPVDAGWGTLRKTLDHVISNIEAWTDLMMERPVQHFSGQDSVKRMLERLDQRYPEFAAFALRIEREGRLDELWTDVLDEPPVQKSYGGAIGHLITHSMHHRAEILHILKRVGVENLPEGDLMGWDQRRRLG
jgi:uncharacterized damage-inducible protein DinB